MPKETSITILIDKDLKKEIKMILIDEEITLTQFINDMIRKYVENKKRKQS